MKKKIASIALAVCVLAIGIIGATMAYFTDNESKTNTFTMGKGVYIDLTETSQTGTTPDGKPIYAGTPVDENGDKVTDPSDAAGFKYDAVLPGMIYSKKPVITVDAESNDCWLVATVTIQNRSLFYKIYENDSNVNHGTWLSLAGSAALVKGGISDYTVYPANYNGMSGNKLNDGTKDIAFVGYSEDATDDTITYTYYFFDKQSAGASYTLFETLTVPGALTQEMLDKNGDGVRDITSIDVTVKAYAIQAEGFADAYAAYQAAFES